MEVEASREAALGASRRVVEAIVVVMVLDGEAARRMCGGWGWEWKRMA